MGTSSAVELPARIQSFPVAETEQVSYASNAFTLLKLFFACAVRRLLRSCKCFLDAFLHEVYPVLLA